MIVSALWVGNAVSKYETACLLSFVAQGYEVRLYCYDSNLAVPVEIQKFDANDIIPEKSVWQNPGSSTFAGFSNQFRYELLSTEDTVWIDTDVIATKNAMSPNNGYLYGWESRKFINTAVLGLPKNSELLRQLRERAGNVDLDNYRWGQIGPRLLTELIRGLSLEHLALPESAFYAVGYKDAWKFFHPRQTAFVEEALENSSAVHLWNEFLRNFSLPIKTMAPHPRSFLGRKWHELGIDADGMSVISPWKVKQHWMRMVR